MKLSAEDLKRVAGLHGGSPPCKSCAVFAFDGWESFPSLSSDAADALIPFCCMRSTAAITKTGAFAI